MLFLCFRRIHNDEFRFCFRSNCGPLLIKDQGGLNPEDKDLIAIPGKYTTANFLLNYAYPELQNKKEILFSDIESAVKTKEVSAGLIIHENRFTYAERVLKS